MYIDLGKTASRHAHVMQTLYAAGFNAWGQLQFGTKSALANGVQDEPDDTATFTRVFEASKILHVRPSLSYTAVTTSDGIVSAGAAPVDSINGAEDESNLCFSEAMNGRVVGWSTLCSTTCFYLFLLTLTTTLTTELTVYNKSEGALLQYASVGDFSTARRLHSSSNTATCTHFIGFPGVVQVVAYDVGFAMLTADGQVWTWGDSRFPECLGRDVADSPINRPGRVIALDDLPTGPIVKLAAGGHVLAAVTRGKDLYCWGGYPGRRPVLPEGVTGEPAPIIVTTATADSSTEEADVVDVGVGDGHMIVLAADGSVYVIGNNANGQLGLGHGDDDDGSSNKMLSAWVKVSGLPSGQVTGVYAGARSSFIVVTR